MKYAFIQRHRRVWPISVQCRVLGVSVAGYHEHLARRREIASRRHLSNEALLVHIRARGKRRFRIATTDSRHGLPIAPNLLHRNFTAARPNQVWAGDISYIPTDEGWMYLAVVLDLFNREVVGWSMGEDVGCELVIDAFEMAWYRRSVGRGTGLMFHSDRGSQYASESFRELLRRRGVEASMSRKGNCWDNACSESLFGSLKVERLHGQHFATVRQAKDEALDWLLWYNQTRLHSTLNYVSPVQYGQNWVRETEKAMEK
jgi:transposase InsO family protein